LWEFAVIKRRHLATRNAKIKYCLNIELHGDGPADLDEDSLDATVTAPVAEHCQLGRVDFTVGLRDEGEVDARDELDRRWSIWVTLAADNLERVDAVLVYGLDSRAP
jgi:hypothetical protein